MVTYKDILRVKNESNTNKQVLYDDFHNLIGLLNGIKGIKGKLRIGIYKVINLIEEVKDNIMRIYVDKGTIEIDAIKIKGINIPIKRIVIDYESVKVYISIGIENLDANINKELSTTIGSLNTMGVYGVYGGYMYKLYVDIESLTEESFLGDIKELSKIINKYKEIYREVRISELKIDYENNKYMERFLIGIGDLYRDYDKCIYNGYIDLIDYEYNILNISGELLNGEDVVLFDGVSMYIGDGIYISSTQYINYKLHKLQIKLDLNNYINSIPNSIFDRFNGNVLTKHDILKYKYIKHRKGDVVIELPIRKDDNSVYFEDIPIIIGDFIKESNLKSINFYGNKYKGLR